MTDLPHEAVSIAVLAGGQGRRLGCDKAQVLLADEPLLSHVLRRLTGLSDDVLLVTRGDSGWPMDGVRLVHDMPYSGVMAGMAAGLSAARHDWCLLVACDMPFLDPALVRHMVTRRCGYQAVVPRLAVGLEPLHALYHRDCLDALHRCLERGERRVSAFCGMLHALYLDAAELADYSPDGRSFFNVNTPEDLARAEAWLAESGAR
jgi:molybdopterin-guanine dinucleotide biosynthesis protein A